MVRYFKLVDLTGQLLGGSSEHARRPSLHSCGPRDLQTTSDGSSQHMLLDQEFGNARGQRTTP
jgi:hypothetical protein